MRFPSIADVARSLQTIKRNIDVAGDDTEVRLQVDADGDWRVLWGDPCYDTDHRGFWGASCLDGRSNCREVAKQLLDDAKDHHATCSMTPRAKRHKE